MNLENQKEIDLIELYQKSLVFIAKNFLTFVIFGIIGLLSGTAYYYIKSNIIKTQFLIETSDISKELVYNLTEKVAFSIRNSDLKYLKKDLKLDQSTINNIKNISIDTNKNILNLSIISNSKESVLPFTQALVNFFNNQDYIKKQQAQKVKETTQLKEKIEEEISNINKFQKQFLEQTTESKITINQIDGSHSEKLKLFKMQQECEAILNQKQAITLINKNNNIIKKENSLVKILILSVVISILFSLFFFFIRFSIALKNKAKTL